MNEIEQLRQKLDILNMEKELTLGRANGLNMAVLVMARGWGQPASELISHLEEAIERIEADALHLPLADATREETTRVARQILGVLHHAQGDGG